MHGSEFLIFHLRGWIHSLDLNDWGSRGEGDEPSWTYFIYQFEYFDLNCERCDFAIQIPRFLVWIPGASLSSPSM